MVKSPKYGIRRLKGIKFHGDKIAVAQITSSEIGEKI